MKIGVIGLGLIGGSMAKAIRLNTDSEVFGTDIDRTVVMRAKVIEAIGKELTEENISECDIIILALYPEASIKALKKYASKIKKGAYVVDCGGVKEKVCKEASDISKEYGFTFVGGHPMAGIEKIGFKYSDAKMFCEASMILTPEGNTDIKVLDELKKFFLGIGFGKITIKTPKEHDRIIAYTSQLAHILSNAYVKSETADDHIGLSAGSFKDMTRVAYLNETMWTELFLENRENLIDEIDILTDNLKKYREALKNSDEVALKELLKDGREKKEHLDK